MLIHPDHPSTLVWALQPPIPPAFYTPYTPHTSSHTIVPTLDTAHAATLPDVAHARDRIVAPCASPSSGPRGSLHLLLGVLVHNS
jgi:hypothetical protein